MVKHSGAAGRKLDARVAEDVMGWRTRTSSFATTGQPDVWYADDGQPAGWSVGGFRPSRDVHSAFRLVQRLNALGVLVQIEQSEPADWFVEMTRAGERVAVSGWVDADELPVAICRAALAAMEAA
jgi:hypothetical protein